MFHFPHPVANPFAYLIPDSFTALRHIKIKNQQLKSKDSTKLKDTLNVTML